MCGIAGPADSGIVAAGRVCLGSRRLSIIDLSPAGHMPMSDESGRWRITYNGEVYNFESLREELLALGHTFRSRTDTEVVLHAWMEWGEGCVDRFVGMYAFAVYDGERDVLTLVRDRYGIKPLYYSTDGGHFMFASELKAIATERSALRVDHHSLLEWSLYRNVDALTGETLVEGVSAVLPGHRLEFRNGHLDDRELYAPPDAVSPDEFERFAPWTDYEATEADADATHVARSLTRPLSPEARAELRPGLERRDRGRARWRRGGRRADATGQRCARRNAL